MRNAGNERGAEAATLRKATLALVHSTEEYCAPIGWRSACAHLIGSTINEALRFVTEWLLTIPSNKS